MYKPLENHHDFYKFSIEIFVIGKNYCATQSFYLVCPFSVQLSIFPWSGINLSDKAVGLNIDWYTVQTSASAFVNCLYSSCRDLFRAKFSLQSFGRQAITTGQSLSPVGFWLKTSFSRTQRCITQFKKRTESLAVVNLHFHSRSCSEAF